MSFQNVRLGVHIATLQPLWRCPLVICRYWTINLTGLPRLHSPFLRPTSLTVIQRERKKRTSQTFTAWLSSHLFYYLPKEVSKGRFQKEVERKRGKKKNKKVFSRISSSFRNLFYTCTVLLKERKSSVIFTPMIFKIETLKVGRWKVSCISPTTSIIK